jgi:hypothetical protein
VGLLVFAAADVVYGLQVTAGTYVRARRWTLDGRSDSP